jgi:EAL domain-containing protein (putative c-di-GMP-specific phosphodiesterase class I)
MKEEPVGTPLDAILAHESLSVDLQPIVSVRRKAVIGVESLARARQVADGVAVPPYQLFEWGTQEDRMLELDRLCRKQALQAFSALPQRHPDLLLFMNLEVSIIEKALRSNHLLDAVRLVGLHPSNIVIEINESAVQSQAALEDFVARYRAQGFLVALDDLGSGHSNLQRWPQLQPDIIKVDRSLVHGLSGDFYQQEVLRSLAALGRQTGALVLAEGVELEADLEACLDFGVDLFQGFFFSKPIPSASYSSTQALGAMDGIAQRHRARAVKRMVERRREFEQHRELLRELSESLYKFDSADFDAVLRSALGTPQLECLFVVDERGLQVTSTVFPKPVQLRQRGSLFQPAQKGTDHSAKDYFFGLIEAGLRHFITEPYLSLATGNMCRTMTLLMPNRGGHPYVLCADLRVQ